MRNKPDLFPQLSILPLQREALRWVNQYPAIKRITLHPNSDQSIDSPFKYDVVWEVEEGFPLSQLDMSLEAGNFFGRNFLDVYKHQHLINGIFSHTYDREWSFKSIPWNEDASPAEIFGNDFFWMLYPSSFPEPVRDPEPEPLDDSTSEPVDETEPEPADDSTSEPIAETEPEPSDDTTSEPVEDTEPEPADDSTPEPVADIEPEPADDSTSEPIEETEPEPVDDSEPEPVDDTEPEPADDSTPEPVADIATEPVVDPESQEDSARIVEDQPDSGSGEGKKAPEEDEQKEKSSNMIRVSGPTVSKTKRGYNLEIRYNGESESVVGNESLLIVAWVIHRWKSRMEGITFSELEGLINGVFCGDNPQIDKQDDLTIQKRDSVGVPANFSPKKIQDLRQRQEELQGEFDQAKRNNDPETIAIASEKLKSFHEEILAEAKREKIKKHPAYAKIRSRYKNAQEKIEGVFPKFGEHIADSFDSKSGELSYRPKERNISWSVEL